MLNEIDTAMKKSTNFEFMRLKEPMLADTAASVESLSHDCGHDAVNLLRSFAEKLLQTFMEERGGKIRAGYERPDGPTLSFIDLLRNCEDRTQLWHVPNEQQCEFKRLLFDGNKAEHRRDFSTANALPFVEVAWNLARWVWTQLKWGDVPSRFDEPPRGGHEVARLRQVNQAYQEQSQHQPVHLDHWDQRKQQQLRLRDRPAFVGRERIFSEIKNFLKQTPKQVLLIEGFAGRGKTALIEEFFINHVPTTKRPFVYFLQERESGEAARRNWIRHFYSAFLNDVALDECDERVLNVGPDDLVLRLQRRLADFCQSQPDQEILFIIDAIDEAGLAMEEVTNFLAEPLPPNVRVIATSLPNTLTISNPARQTLLNLEQVKWRHLHRKDCHTFVRSRLPGLADELADRIANFDDGNFLVVPTICEEVREQKTDARIRDILKKWERDPKGDDSRWDAPVRRTWQRLKRSEPKLFEAVETVSGFLAVAQKTLSDKVLIDLLKRKVPRAVWAETEQFLVRYLRKSPSEVEDGRAEYELCHRTFRRLVRRELGERKLQELEFALASYCVEFLNKQDATLDTEFALPVIVQHFIGAGCWEESVALLTDLAFIEARFVAEQGHELLEAYDLALQSHSETKSDFDSRDEQDKALDQSIEKLVQYSRVCTRIREAHPSGEVLNPDEVAEVVEGLRFLEKVVDTSSTIKEMQKTESTQRPHSVRRSKDSSIKRLRDFQWFITSQLNILRELPHTTLNIASNFTTTGPVADAVKEAKRKGNGATEVALIRTNRTPPPPPDSLVLRMFDDELKEDGDGPFWGEMTPNARIGYGDNGWSNRVWDLRTGKRLLTKQGKFCVWDVSIDGRWAVISSDRPDGHFIQLVDVECDEAIDGPRMFESPWGLFVSVTPDGKRVVYIDRSSSPDRFSLVVWDTDTNTTSTLSIGKRPPSCVLLCMSGMVAVVETETRKDSKTHVVWTFFDLMASTRLRRVPASKVPAFLADCWFGKDVILSARLERKLCTLDGKLTVDQSWESVSISQKGRSQSIRRFGTRRPFLEIGALSADGRYALAKTKNAFCLLDLANGTLLQEPNALSDSTTASAADTTPTHLPMAGRDECELARELQLSLNNPSEIDRPITTSEEMDGCE